MKKSDGLNLEEEAVLLRMAHEIHRRLGKSENRWMRSWGWRRPGPLNHFLKELLKILINNYAQIYLENKAQSMRVADFLQLRR